MAETNGNGRKLDLAKFLARSFLLPLVGMAMAFVLVLKGIKDVPLYVGVGALLTFCGLFNLPEAFKTWAQLKYGKADPK